MFEGPTHMTEDLNEEEKATVRMITRQWGTNGDLRAHLKRVKSLEHVGTEEQFDKFIRARGNSVEATERDEWVDELRNERKYRGKTALTVQSVALWISIVLGSWAALKLGLAEFFSGVGK
jgi:hypothetical protein